MTLDERRILFAQIKVVADLELARIHGPASADYVLGYQRCAKAILTALEIEWGNELRGKSDG